MNSLISIGKTGNLYKEILGVLEWDSTQETEPIFLDSSAITAGNLLDNDLIFIIEDASSWEIIYLNDLSADNNSNVTGTDHSSTVWWPIICIRCFDMILWNFRLNCKQKCSHNYKDN